MTATGLPRPTRRSQRRLGHGTDGRWSGTFTGGDGGTPVPFDGRLQLLRMLEELVDPPAATTGTETGMDAP